MTDLSFLSLGDSVLSKGFKNSRNVAPRFEVDFDEARYTAEFIDTDRQGSAPHPYLQVDHPLGHDVVVSVAVERPSFEGGALGVEIANTPINGLTLELWISCFDNHIRFWGYGLQSIWRDYPDATLRITIIG